jgi:hypothetical protein
MAATLVIALSGCAITLYEGQERPLSEAGVLESNDILVDRLDGKDVESERTVDTRFVLPPGPHVASVRLQKVKPGFFVTTR